ncbi:hypothetical protein LX32DRAFT_731786 [Colletotrichum zoysiae]|uniref:Uncharacterized protein n=1 Tax=Colletotrichum zoysiae TaxID=1216348 RepID=A0AAD9LVQ4_9PEZI|nr:hypothetical protein LX32DRAFT_731786 [Colletotrichum zoysiae]
MLEQSPIAISKRRNALFLCYEKKQDIRMPCAVFSGRPPSHPNFVDIPIIAYLDHQDLRRDRKAGRHPVTISDPTRDPYVVALLIALAQSQRRNLQRACIRAGKGTHGPAATSFQVHIFLGDALIKPYLLVYTAEIPVAALDRLADFRWTPQNPTDFVVHTTEVPFEPYQTFPERLLQATFPGAAHVSPAPPPKKRRPSSEASPVESFKVARVE